MVPRRYKKYIKALALRWAFACRARHHEGRGRECATGGAAESGRSQAEHREAYQSAAEVIFTRGDERARHICRALSFWTCMFSLCEALIISHRTAAEHACCCTQSTSRSMPACHGL